ncbi:S58 family peptidase [Mesorhizobium sp. M8A.F.Ca.ET.207.01.1.1]|uniref:DmpA family aminopeptidase n=1 Tax=Mesorhizobium sp. M8A.F.Ca.ET.207.01.1.1 TaxID=2563968 RepID=UPI00109C5A5D|nr:P1 family peptidase [Mesorhizobium sp. M8A.F.Ca.ET.207.01.1.1]TGQ84026.1 S58 family peptidase [Mesorhizobium sp. M8A.F.Ca.ET.207.01.1.1]
MDQLPTHTTTPAGKARARALAIPLQGTPGPANAITDVGGVLVGYSTIIKGEGKLALGQGPVRTGVTAILPFGHDGVGVACAAGYHSFNGNGEMTGASWIEEAGSISLPILITNTHAVGPCHRGIIDWVARHKPDVADQWLLPVVAETWDGYLNDINGSHVTVDHATAAIDNATSGHIEEGSVGGGTGMNCYAFKGGSGTASRVVDYGHRSYTVGVFLQANFGSRRELTIAGAPLGNELADDNPMEAYFSGGPTGAGSCIGIVATDAPLLPGQCKALARRVPLGLARTGTTGSHFSGDIFLAFSTANRDALNGRFPRGPATEHSYGHMDFIPWGRMDDFYAAVVQAAEEAVLNALVANSDMIGRDGNRTPALPHAKVVTALNARGVMADRQ